MTSFLRPLSITSVLICGLSVTACTSVPQDGVVATDISGSFSQMWSNVFTGELRRAPQTEYSFGGNDATLNTPLLMSRVAHQPASAPYYQANYAAHSPQIFPSKAYKPAAQLSYQRAVQPPAQIDVQIPTLQPQPDLRLSPENPWSRRQSASASLESYEDFRPQQTASLPPIKNVVPPRPLRSEPVIADPYVEREAYPTQSAAPKKEIQTISRRATIDENLAKMGRSAAPISPAASQNWRAANQEIGDSLSYVKMGGGSQISDWQGCEAEAGNYFLTTASGFAVAPQFDSCMRAKGYKPEAEAEAELAASAS